MQALRRWLGAIALGCAAAMPLAAAAQDLEYRIKAAFVYNFMLFTEWPAEIGPTLQLCLVGADPFGREIDALAGRPVGQRVVAVQRKAAGEALRGCHGVFFSAAVAEQLPRLLEGLRGQPVLTIADSPGATRQGVVLNLRLAQDKVAFDVNLQAARAAGLPLSSKLLRLASEVIQ